MSRIIFVGAGPGDPDLITVKGRRAIESADIILYAGSLVPPAMLTWAGSKAETIDSSGLAFDEIMEVFARADRDSLALVRLHSGDPSIYGAIQEQIDWLRENEIDFAVIPGVTAAFAAAAVIGRELTMPEISQTVILSRVAGRTPVPEGQDLESLAKIQATLCLYLSIDKVDEVAGDLLKYYPADTPTAVVYHASRPDEKVWRLPLAGLAEVINGAGITSTAVILIGAALGAKGSRSKLYDKEFTHGCRE